MANPMRRTKINMKANGLPVLKTGIAAFYDTMRSGLVPVKVLEVKAPAKPPTFDLRSGLAPVSIKVKALVTKDQGAYYKGMIIDTDSTKVPPKAAIKRGQHSTTIRLYTVQPDTAHNPPKSCRTNPPGEVDPSWMSNAGIGRELRKMAKETSFKTLRQAVDASFSEDQAPHVEQALRGRDAEAITYEVARNRRGANALFKLLFKGSKTNPPAKRKAKSETPHVPGFWESLYHETHAQWAAEDEELRELKRAAKRATRCEELLHETAGKHNETVRLYRDLADRHNALLAAAKRAKTNPMQRKTQWTSLPYTTTWDSGGVLRRKESKAYVLSLPDGRVLEVVPDAEYGWIASIDGLNMGRPYRTAKAAQDAVLRGSRHIVTSRIYDPKVGGWTAGYSDEGMNRSAWGATQQEAIANLKAGRKSKRKTKRNPVKRNPVKRKPNQMKRNPVKRKPNQMKRNPSRAGARWRMSDGRILTTAQLKHTYFGTLPSMAHRHLLGITRVTKEKTKKNPVSKKRKTVRFYYNDDYMGYRIWSPTARVEVSSWLRNNGRYPDKYSVKIGNKIYRSMKALP